MHNGKKRNNKNKMI